jgi:hypothetical protein
MGLEDLTPDAKEAVDAFEQKNRIPTKEPAVYVLYFSETGEPLYVGQTKNLFQRITDHHLGYHGGDLRSRIENDDNISIDTAEGEMWENTELKWVEVEGGERQRRLVENFIENRLNPRYASN